MILGLIGLESIIVYRITTIERQKQLKLRTKVARKQFINRWDSLLARVKSKAMSQSAVGQDGPSSAPSLTTPQKRWKAAVQNATDSSTQGQKDLVANGGSRERDRGQPSTSQEKKDRKKDESDQVYGGAMGVYMPGLDSTSDSEPYGGASDGSSFASTPRMEREKSAALALQKEQAQAAAVPKKASTAAKGMEGAAASAPGTVSASEMAASPFAGVSNDEEAALSAGCFKLRRRKKKAPPPQPGEELPLPPQPNWFQVQWAKLREMRREVSRNQDYALHIAMRIDFGCAVITGLGYIIALVLILAVQSSYQVNESYVTYKNLSNATSSS